ncbi:hypothetical protein V9L05_20575 [Bernardetia sp. Wsw4-3y2]|uniref:hypothetical protein n=1 Tax=Bernardetia sp. Wsw4-3y2 TaxID=3127471 RepID=UPI0030D3744E
MQKTPFEMVLSLAKLGGGVLDASSLIENSNQIDLMAQNLIQELNGQKVTFNSQDIEAFFQVRKKVKRMGGIHNLNNLLTILETNGMLDSFSNTQEVEKKK